MSVCQKGNRSAANGSDNRKAKTWFFVGYKSNHTCKAQTSGESKELELDLLGASLFSIFSTGNATYASHLGIA